MRNRSSDDRKQRQCGGLNREPVRVDRRDQRAAVDVRRRRARYRHLGDGADPPDHPGRGEWQLGRAAEERLAVGHREQVRAELVDLAEQAGLRRRRQTEHRDDRRHPDRDPERRERRAQPPRAQADARDPGQVGEAKAAAARLATGSLIRRHGWLTSANAAARPAAVARTTYPPRVPSATNEGATAMPLASVFALAVLRLPPKRPLAPSRGAENVTATPATGLPFLSVTVTARRIGKRVPTVVASSAAAPGGECVWPPGRFRSEKATVRAARRRAVAVNRPAAVFAVRRGEEAIPLRIRRLGRLRQRRPRSWLRRRSTLCRPSPRRCSSRA